MNLGGVEGPGRFSLRPPLDPEPSSALAGVGSSERGVCARPRRPRGAASPCFRVQDALFESARAQPLYLSLSPPRPSLIHDVGLCVRLTVDPPNTAVVRRHARIPRLKRF